MGKPTHHRANIRDSLQLSPSKGIQAALLPNAMSSNPQHDFDQKKLIFSVAPNANGSHKGSTGSIGENLNKEAVEEERKDVDIQGFDMNFSIPAHIEPSLPVLSKVQQQEAKMSEERQSQKGSRFTNKKDSEYLRFFRFYFEKLKILHSKWNNSQISTIISLQWKKKKMIDKTKPQSCPSVSSRRSSKPLTAKQAFKRENRDKPTAEINSLWNNLPKESKIFWRKQGESFASGSVGAKESEVNSTKPHAKKNPIQINAVKLLLNCV